MATRKAARSTRRRRQGTIDVKIHPPKSGHVVCEVSTEADGVTLYCRRTPVSERSALGADLESEHEEVEDLGAPPEEREEDEEPASTNTSAEDGDDDEEDEDEE